MGSVCAVLREWEGVCGRGDTEERYTREENTTEKTRAMAEEGNVGADNQQGSCSRRTRD